MRTLNLAVQVPDDAAKKPNYFEIFILSTKESRNYHIQKCEVINASQDKGVCKWLHKTDGLKYNLKPGCILDFEHWEYNDFFLDEFPEYKYCPFCGLKIERI